MVYFVTSDFLHLTLRMYILKYFSSKSVELLSNYKGTLSNKILSAAIKSPNSKSRKIVDQGILRKNPVSPQVLRKDLKQKRKEA